MTNKLYGGTLSGSLGNAPAKTQTSLGTDIMSRFRQVENKPLATTGVVVPGGAELTALNQKQLGTVAMPNLSVYTPDYGALESSFQDILKSYEGYKQAAQGQYGAQKASLDTNLQQQMQSIGTAKTENKQAFSKGQAQLAQDVFMTNRATQAAASARGLTGSGVEALANIQNRMAAGEKISDMANQYFDAQTQLVQTEQATRQNYDNSLQNLNSSLQSAMAQIMSQEASSKMDYTQTVENLKRQVLADTNAMKQAQYEWQVANEQAKQAATITDSMIQQFLGSGASVQQRVADLMTLGMTASQANQAVTNYDTQATATASTTMYGGLQQEVDNMLSENPTMSESAVKAALIAKYGSGSIDYLKLDLNGTGVVPTPASRISTLAALNADYSKIPSAIGSALMAPLAPTKR